MDEHTGMRPSLSEKKEKSEPAGDRGPVKLHF